MQHGFFAIFARNAVRQEYGVHKPHGPHLALFGPARPATAVMNLESRMVASKGRLIAHGPTEEDLDVSVFISLGITMFHFLTATLCAFFSFLGRRILLNDTNLGAVSEQNILNVSPMIPSYPLVELSKRSNRQFAVVVCVDQLRPGI